MVGGASCPCLWPPAHPQCSPRPVLPLKPPGCGEKPNTDQPSLPPLYPFLQGEAQPLGAPRGPVLNPKASLLGVHARGPWSWAINGQEGEPSGQGMAPGECSGMDGGCARGPYHAAAPLWDGQGRVQGRPWLVLTQGKRMASPLSVRRWPQGHQNLPHLIPERGRDLKACSKVLAFWCEDQPLRPLVTSLVLTLTDRTGAGAAGPAVDGTRGPDMSSEDGSHAGQPQRRGMACLCPRPAGPPGSRPTLTGPGI